jgi:hypothetical protein
LLGEGSLTDAALQTINGDYEGGSLEQFDEAVEEAFVVVGSRLEVFFQDALRIADSLNSQFLIAHWSKLQRNINRQPNQDRAQLVPEMRWRIFNRCLLWVGSRRSAKAGGLRPGSGRL